jgi:hypothetical protein
MQMTKGSQIKGIKMGWTYDCNGEEEKCILNFSEESVRECSHFEN